MIVSWKELTFRLSRKIENAAIVRGISGLAHTSSCDIAKLCLASMAQPFFPPADAEWLKQPDIFVYLAYHIFRASIVALEVRDKQT